jgi:oligopeptide transport system substrate-binding protein
MTFVQSHMSAASMFDKGKIDWVGDPLGILPREEALHLLDKGTALSQAVDRIFLLYFNTTHPWLKSAKIRQALAMTVDRKQITDHLVFGVPTTCITKTKTDLMIQEQEAKQLFEEGLRELGVQKKDMMPLVFKCFTAHKSMAEYIQEKWKSLFGIRVGIECYDYLTYRQMLIQRDFAVGGNVVSILYKDPLALLARFEDSNDAANFCSWENTEFKENIHLCRAEVDLSKREERLINTEQVLLRDIPFSPLFRFKHVYAHHPKLKGYVFDGAGCVDFAYASFD